MSSVHYRVGQDVFSRARRYSYIGLETIFQVILAPLPAGAHSHSCPGQGPLCYQLFRQGGPARGTGEVGANTQTGAGNAEKDTLPQDFEWGGVGKRAELPPFLGPCPPPP